MMDDPPRSWPRSLGFRSEREVDFSRLAGEWSQFMTHADLTTPRLGNPANQITALRLALCLLLFAALQWHWYGWSLGLFVIAAGTDWLDGYLARRWNLVTQLGRILDPLADKILICGTYVYLSAAAGSGIAPWMAVVVMVREFVVTVLRSFLEQHGRDFSAKMPGKVKMVLQSAAAVASLLLLLQHSSGTVEPIWLLLVRLLAWAMVLSTVHSGILYVMAAARLLRSM